MTMASNLQTCMVVSHVLSDLECFSSAKYTRFPTRAQVDAANNRRLNELEGPMHYYQAEDHAGRGDNDMQLTGEEAERILNRETMAQQSIKLKVNKVSLYSTDGVFIVTTCRSVHR